MWKYQLQALKRMIDNENSGRTLLNYLGDDFDHEDIIPKVYSKSNIYVNALKAGAGKCLLFSLLFIETMDKRKQKEHKDLYILSSYETEVMTQQLNCNIVIASDNILENAWMKCDDKHIEHPSYKTYKVKDSDFPQCTYRLARENNKEDLIVYKNYARKLRELGQKYNTLYIDPSTFVRMFYIIRLFKFERLVVDEPHLVIKESNYPAQDIFRLSTNNRIQPFKTIYICCATPSDIYEYKDHTFGAYIVDGSGYLKNSVAFKKEFDKNFIAYSPEYIDEIQKIPKDIIIPYYHKCNKLLGAVEFLNNSELNEAIENEDYSKIGKILGIQTTGPLSVKDIYNSEIAKHEYAVNSVKDKISKKQWERQNEEINGHIVDFSQINLGRVIEEIMVNNIKMYKVSRNFVLNSIDNDIKIFNESLKILEKRFNDVKERFEQQYNNFINGTSECDICFNEINGNTILTSCNHQFCSCTYKWFVQMHQSTCPSCRSQCTIKVIDRNYIDDGKRKIYGNKTDIITDISKLPYYKVLLCRNNLNEENTSTIESLYKTNGYEVYNFSDKENKVKLYNNFVGNNEKSLIIIDSAEDSAGLDFDMVDCKVYHDEIMEVVKHQIDGRTNRAGRKSSCTTIVITSE